MSWKLHIRKRRLARCRNQFNRRKKVSEERKKKLEDRRNKLSARFIKIITNIIDKIESRLRQRLPQRELEQIVHRALSARYPDTYYRLRNDLQPSRWGTSLLYNLSVMDVGSVRDSLWRCVYDLYMDSVLSSRRVTLAVVTQPPHLYTDPRSDWRATKASVLRVMNPDLRTGTDSSSDGESESLGSDSGSVGSMLTLLTDSSSGSGSGSDGSGWFTIVSEDTIDENFGCDASSLDCGTHDWSDDEIESSVSGGLSALAMRPSSESSGERTVYDQPDDSSVTRVNYRVSDLPSDDIVPRLPDLYFVDRPDPSLYCVVTSTLYDLNPSMWSCDGLWPCSNTIHAAGCHTTRDFIPEDEAINSTTDAIHHARRVNVLDPYKTTDKEGLIPPPLDISKNNENPLRQEPMHAVVSASSTTSASTTPNLRPTRRRSLCPSCCDIRERRRTLNSHLFHPIQITHQSDQAADQTRPSNPNDLPSPMRAGPRCTHCRNTWAGMISTPELLSPQLSTRGETEEREHITPTFMGRTNDSFNVAELIDVAFNTAENLSLTPFPPHLIMCLNSGAVARNRRIFDNDGFT